MKNYEKKLPFSSIEGFTRFNQPSNQSVNFVHFDQIQASFIDYPLLSLININPFFYFNYSYIPRISNLLTSNLKTIISKDFRMSAGIGLETKINSLSIKALFNFAAYT